LKDVDILRHDREIREAAAPRGCVRMTFCGACPRTRAATTLRA
jgi:hypothetical protein